MQGTELYHLFIIKTTLKKLKDEPGISNRDPVFYFYNCQVILKKRNLMP